MSATTLSIVSASSDEFGRICSLIEKTHPVDCIVAIHKITNDSFVTQFEECRERLTQKNNTPPTEMLVFHGCNYDSGLNIAEKGFDISYNTTSAYGKGTYFGTAYSVSRNYSLGKKREAEYNALIVANILLGKVGVDVYTNAKVNPSIISLPINEAALPRYLVQFYVENSLRKR
jgi:hypothetical protein